VSSDTTGLGKRTFEAGAHPEFLLDENLARIIIAGVIGLTVSISMIAMAISKMVTSRRRKELPDSSVARLEERLERMEMAIDAMATEVERVAEGQRFTTKLLADRQVKIEN
jgi:hypothetical protein